MRHFAGIAAVSVTLLHGALAGAATSPVISVVIEPEQSFAWATAAGNVLELPIDFPEGATSAKLDVTGSFGYAVSYADITGTSFLLTLPAATDAASEQVYALTLTFNDSPATVRTARIGCIVGYDGTSAASAACRVNESARRWGRSETQKAVLPIPYGTETLTVNGVAQTTGLDGAAGWYGLKVNGTSESPQTVEISGDGWSESADLRTREGLSVLIR